MALDTTQKGPDNSQKAEPSPESAADGAVASDTSDAQVADMVLFDDFEELDAKARASTRRRNIIIGFVLAIGAVVVPVVTLLAIGRFSLANLRPVSRVRPAMTRPATPAPPPLSPEQRRVRDAKIAADLHNYLWNQIPPVVSEEAVAEKAFASVTNANYRDDRTSYNTIRNVVIPHYAHFVALAGTIRVETEQVRIAHYLMLTAARLKLMAYQEIVAGENDPDHLGRVAVLADFTEATRRAGLYQEAIMQLAQATHSKVPPR